ncbi:hypothetical protein [Nocardioides sp. R-C-SC26]|uniref:hypothetical protein n=1 Tax=Nocardioides sp. R-C-SC26 TaxID=2870414 RepID=UPI001E540B11|nr:hypothetical protein [Nocardioides sp. R-C-SC26]
MPDQNRGPDRNDDLFHDFRPEIGMSPVSGAEIRRRGDRRRRRRALATGVATAAVIAAVVTPVALSIAGDDKAGVDPATFLPGRDAALLTPSDLPDRSERGENQTPLLPWELWTPTEAAEEFPLLGCAPGLLDQLPDATTASVQLGAELDLELEPGDVVPPSPPSGKVGEVIVDFGSAAEAMAAYDTLAGQIATCDDPGPGRQLTDFANYEPRDVLAGDGEAFLARRDIWDDAVCDWRDGCDGWNTEYQGLARFADRLVVFSYAEINGNFEPERLDQAASDAFDQALLKAGAQARPSSPTTEPVDSQIQPADPDAGSEWLDDLPLDEGLVAMEADGGEARGPRLGLHTVTFAEGSCLAGLWPAADGVTLGASASGPEYYDAREVVRFPTVGEAADAFGAVVDGVLNTCPIVTSDIEGNDLTYTELTDQRGEPTFAFSAIYATGVTGNSVYAFGFYGDAVIAIQRSGEMGGSPESVQAASTAALQDLLQIRDEVCDRTECSS